VPFLNDLPILILTDDPYFSFFIAHTLFATREAFGEILGNISNHMWLANSLHIHNVDLPMMSRTPSFFEDSKLLT
jgi:hypothetical protein